ATPTVTFSNASTTSPLILSATATPACCIGEVWDIIITVQGSFEFCGSPCTFLLLEPGSSDFSDLLEVGGTTTPIGSIPSTVALFLISDSETTSGPISCESFGPSC